MGDDDVRIKNLEDRINKINGVREKTASLETKVEILCKEIDEIKIAIKDVSNQVSALDKKFTVLFMQAGAEDIAPTLMYQSQYPIPPPNKKEYSKYIGYGTAIGIGLYIASEIIKYLVI